MQHKWIDFFHVCWSCDSEYKRDFSNEDMNKRVEIICAHEQIELENLIRKIVSFVKHYL